MRKTLFIKTILIVLLGFFSSPAGADLYSWTDSEGIVNFSNSRESAPLGAKVEVWPESPAPPASKKSPDAEPARSEPETVPPPEADLPRRADPSRTLSVEAAPVTQGRFVFLLAQELGLGEGLTTEEAADLLTRIRVSPPRGRWKLEAPITPALVTRLRTLAVSAAEMQTISITPEEALIAFDTTAALLGVPIAAGSDRSLSDRSLPEELYAPTLQSPPLVLIASPPPEIITYYTWVPVQSGFFWSGVWCDGFFILDQGHRDFRFDHRRFTVPARLIEDRFNDRLFRNHLRNRRGTDRRHGEQVIVPPGPPIVDPGTVIPSEPLRPEARLRGGRGRSFSTGPRVSQTLPPSNLTPITPPSGTSALTPLAPRTPMTPMAGSLRGPTTREAPPRVETDIVEGAPAPAPSVAPPAAPPAAPSPPATPPRRSLRGR